MVQRVDTIEQFKEIRDLLDPVYITSRSRGKVLVPCCNTILVSTKLIVENQYNPNHVPAEKMKLLMQSILDNGFCFPVVVIYDDESEFFVVIDGFHRTIIGGNGWLEFDYIPLVVLDHDIKRRMAATVQFNKARGVHQVDLDADVIRALIEQGMSEDDICAHLGIDEETVHRYKQLTGIAELFKNSDYSISWGMKEIPDEH
jgi:ParB-like chromosome segregation protein Spo0J